MRIDLGDAHWYAGLTLLERHLVMSGGPIPRGGPTPEASHRWQQWRHRGPWREPTLFARRLAEDGLTEERLHDLVHAPIDAIQQACDEPPDWLCELAEALNDQRPNHEPRLADMIEPGRDLTVGFLVAIEPLVLQAHRTFRTELEALMQQWPDAPFTEDTADTVFFDGLGRQLLALVSRTLVLELNVARLRGELRGDTASERFGSFIDRLHQIDVTSRIFKEYPVLARAVLDALHTRVMVRMRLLRHVCEDREVIEATWPVLEGTQLQHVSAPLGDPHRGGQSVLRVGFTHGRELVYKPKSLSIDRHFQGLLLWLNNHGVYPEFRTAVVLDRGDHGWVEAFHHEPCRTSSQITRFYERLGGLVALLYALEATDFHYENLIACGEHPMLVDLEALCHARTDLPHEDGAQVKVMEALWNSVVRVGLLPQRIWANGAFDGVDLSGLGGEAGQRLPMKIPEWEAAGTDEMRLVERDGTLPAGHNRPTLNRQPVDVLSQVTAVERGFTGTYRLLLRHRDELLHADSPLLACADDEVRAILRPTRVYTWLLQECTHPDVLRDALDRDRLLDWLWVDVEHQPRLARAVTAELDDLRRGDVPFFTTTPRTRSIWTSMGTEITGFYERSGLECVEQRLRTLSEDDLARQRWFLRASLTALSPAEERQPDVALTGPPAPPAPSAAFLEAAQRVGDRLEQLAFVTETEASWLGLTLLAEQHWALAPLGVDLYGGLPGVALFLARLGSVTDDPRYHQLAAKATAGFVRQLDSLSAWPLIGAFAGWGGAIYALTHLGFLLRDSTLIERAETLLPKVRERIPADTHFDLISGSAGAIMALTAFHALTGSAEAIIVIREAGEHLVEHAQAMPGDTLGWRSALPSSAPLAGCSHGTAGIALSLLTASALASESRFERVARAAMAYERGLFSEAVCNWPDLRTSPLPTSRPASPQQEQGQEHEPPPQPSFMMAWCHGAPGIGLARLAGLRFVDDANVRRDITLAISATRRNGFGRNHSLCHGDLGNLELLSCAAVRLHEPGLASSVASFASRILRSIRERGWQCGVPLQVETPGLMTGLAGIGDGLLRIAEPRLPSLLMLQPP